MSRDVVMWTGPVAFFQVPGSTLPDAYEISEGCFGDRDPRCMHRAAPLTTILARHNVPLEDVRDVVIGAFSAGGSTVKRMMLDRDSRERTAAVHLADATYTAMWENASERRPVVDEGFVQYALDAIEGPHLLVATASPIPNKTWASGVENLQRIRQEVEQRSGKQFVELDHFFGIEPGPAHAYQLGNVILAEYPLQPLGHGHTHIADQVWDKIIRPWLASTRQPPTGPAPPIDPEPNHPEPPPPAKPRTSLVGLGYVAAGALVGYIGTWAVTRRSNG